jgi:hypothetical protein
MSTPLFVLLFSIFSATNGQIVGVKLFSASSSCAGAFTYEMFDRGRCDNLHGTGSSLSINSGASFSGTLFSNNECNAASPTKVAFTVASGTCQPFGSISVVLFTPLETSAIQMAGTYTQTSCASPTNPAVTCASVLASSYIITQAGFALTWSGLPSSSLVYDLGLVVMRANSGSLDCLGWMDGLQLRLDCFTTTSATPRLEAVYSCSGACSSTTTPTTTTAPSASSPTVWSGTYQVTSQCNTASCCCVTGTFSAVQVGTQVSATAPLTGACGGLTSTSFVLNLASPTSTSGSAVIGGQTITVVKNGASMTLTNTANSLCSGTATCTAGDCLGGSSTTCFHESTTITYKGKAHSLSDFTSHPECHVPHRVKSDGVRIMTTCSAVPLRLTDDHLVFTSTGLRSANTLRPNDVLYSDVDQRRQCHVGSISSETNQLYFGLNCIESVVLANNVKVSTFGNYHFIPATWMKHASAVLGVDRASKWGDALVNILVNVRVL